MKTWPMDEGGIAVKTDGGVEEAKHAYREWLIREGDTFDGLDKVVERAKYREGWYRWTPCHPQSCYEGTQHHPGHIGYADGPGRGVWRGVLVDSW
jgi:hypothetical protein